MSDFIPIAESNNFIVLDKYTQEWQVAETYQSESDLEREFVQDLVNQGYEFLPALNTIVSVRGTTSVHTPIDSIRVSVQHVFSPSDAPRI